MKEGDELTDGLELGCDESLGELLGTSEGECDGWLLGIDDKEGLDEGA